MLYFSSSFSIFSNIHVFYNSSFPSNRRIFRPDHSLMLISYCRSTTCKFPTPCIFFFNTHALEFFPSCMPIFRNIHVSNARAYQTNSSHLRPSHYLYANSGIFSPVTLPLRLFHIYLYLRANFVLTACELPIWDSHLFKLAISDQSNIIRQISAHTSNWTFAFPCSLVAPHLSIHLDIPATPVISLVAPHVSATLLAKYLHAIHAYFPIFFSGHHLEIPQMLVDAATKAFIQPCSQIVDLQFYANSINSIVSGKVNVLRVNIFNSIEKYWTLQWPSPRILRWKPDTFTHIYIAYFPVI